MAELIPTASEAEWLEARRKGITASEIPVVMGISPWSSPYALYHQKLGILPGQLDSSVMERGRVLEPHIAEKFAAAHPEFAVTGDGRALWAHDDRAWQLATPDRMLFRHAELPDFGAGPAAVAEFKTTSDLSEWGEPGTDEIPVHYRAQVLWQMDVMGVDRAYVSVLDVPRWEIREYVIGHGNCFATEASERIGGATPCEACRDLLMMRGEARLFLGRIEREEPPDVDWRPATVGTLKQLHPSVEEFDATIGDRLAANYRAACRNSKHWEQRKKLYEARIRLAAGPAHRAIVSSGEVIARRDVYEVGESVRKGYTVDKLVPVKPKKESK